MQGSPGITGMGRRGNPYQEVPSQLEGIRGMEDWCVPKAHAGDKHWSLGGMEVAASEEGSSKTVLRGDDQCLFPACHKASRPHREAVAAFSPTWLWAACTLPFCRSDINSVYYTVSVSDKNSGQHAKQVRKMRGRGQGRQALRRPSRQQAPASRAHSLSPQEPGQQLSAHPAPAAHRCTNPALGMLACGP